MSSTMKVSLPRTRTPKTVLHERNMSATGTARIAVKRKMVSADKTKQRGIGTDTDTLATKHDIGLSNKDDRKNVLNEKMSQLKTTAGEKGKTATSVLYRVGTNCDENLGSVCPHESVTDENKSIVGETDKLRNDKVKVGPLSSTTNKKCKIEHSEMTKATPRCSTRSKTSDAREHKISKEVVVKQHISSNTNSSTENVASSSETRTGETKSNKLSFPKAKSVITDSCVPNQKCSILSDSSEDTFYSSNTINQTLSVFHKESDTDVNEITEEKLVTQNTSEKIIPSSTKNAKQIIPPSTCSSRNLTLKIEKTETKIAKSLVPKSIPNYLRTTSSSANKNIKSNPNESHSGSSKLRPATQGCRSVSSGNENISTLHHTKKIKSKSDTAPKDWQSGLRSREISAKENQRDASKSVKPNPASKSTSSPDTSVSPELNSNSSETSIVAGENRIKTQNVDNKSRSRLKSLSPSESDPASSTEKKSTNISKLPLKNGVTVVSKHLIPGKSITRNTEDKKGISTLNLKQQTTAIGKKESHVLSSSSRTLFPKPLKLSLKQKNSKKTQDSNSRPTTPVDSKLLSPSLKRKDSPTGVDIVSGSMSSTVRDASVSSDGSQYSRSDSEQTAISLKLQNSQHEQAKDATFVTSDCNAISKLERLDSKQASNMKSNLETGSVSATSTTSSVSLNVKCKTKSAPKHTVTSMQAENPRKIRKVGSDSNLRLRPTRPGATSASIDSKISSKPALKQPLKNQMTSQKDIKINRESNSRSRSSTPGASSTSSSSDTYCTTKRTVCSLKQAINRDSNSRSRSTTPGASSTSSSNDTSTNLTNKEAVRSFKQPNSKNARNISRDSNLRSRSTTPGATSCSDTNIYSSSKRKVSDSKQENSVVDQKIKRDSNSRSRSTTPGASSTSSCSVTGAKRTSKTTVSIPRQEIPQTNKTINRESNLLSRSKPQGTSAASSEKNDNVNKYAAKSSLIMKRQNSQTKKKTPDCSSRSVPTTSCVASAVSSNRGIKSTTKQMTLKQERYQGNKKNNRETKSRSRSSTPGSTSVSTADVENSQSKAAIKQNSKMESKMTREKHSVPHSKISKEFSVFTENNIKSSLSVHTTQSDKGLKSSKLSASGKIGVSTESKKSKISTSTIPKQVPVLKTKAVANIRRNVQKHASSATTVCDIPTTQPGLQGRASDIPIPIQVKSTSVQASVLKMSSEPNTVPSSATKLNLQQVCFKSCNSLTTEGNSGNAKAESEHPSESQNICSNKTHMLSTGTSDKPIPKSTKLSIKPDSLINAGKLSISERNKNSGSIRTSSENRSCVQTGSTHIQKNVNKAFVSDDKSRKTASLSVIKRDNVSTTSCNKSEKIGTYKQKTQLPENLKSCNVNIEHGTEHTCTDNELQSVSLNSELINSANELVSVTASESFIAGKTSLKVLENKKIAQRHITTVSNTVNMDKINCQETQTQCGNNTSGTELMKDSVCKKENLSYEKNEHKDYKERILGEYTISSNTEYTNINFTDLVVTACDPKAKVSSNCLSDNRENEKLRVNEGICPEITSLQNENTTCNCEIQASSHEKCSHYYPDQMDLLQKERVNDTCGDEMLFLKTCDECRKQCDISLQQIDSEPIILCNSCKEALTCCSNSDYYENTNNTVNVENKFKHSNEYVSMDNTSYTSIENCNNLGDSVFKVSQNLKCRNDKRTETKTFEIDTCDVNSSHKVPITEGCAFKHTESTDSQEDKAKCTDAVPVTGAGSLQITNKRQDKKISSSLLSCGIRNTALFNNRNGFVRRVYGYAQVDARDNEGRTVYGQDTRENERRPQFSDLSSNGDDKKWHDFETCETKKSLKDSTCYDGSSAIERSLSDWQSAELYDRICSENMAELQVLNNGEINKELSEPENSCRKLNGDDIFDCDNMDTLQEVNHTAAHEDTICRHHIKCDTICDLNSESQKEIFNEINEQNGNTVSELKYVVSMQNVSGMDSNDCGENIHEECDKRICSNGDKNLSGEDDRNACVSIQLHSVCLDSENLIENSQTHLQNSLTCDSQNDENISYHEDETSLPERNSRTIDATLINTEHDLSFHASCKCENISQSTSESGHTGIDLINYPKSCNCKQYQHDNDKAIEIVSNCAKNDISGTLPRESFLQNQLLRFKPDGFLSESAHQGDITGTPYVLEVQEKQTNCLDYANDTDSLFSQQAITEAGLIMNQSDCGNELREFHDYTADDRKSHRTKDKGKFLLDEQQISSVSEITINNTGIQHQEACSVFQNTNNNLFSKVPKLSECIYKLYPNLQSNENAACSKISIEEEINHENLQCSNMTQTANMNNCSFSMKLNASACLFQHYKQSDRDDINVSPECEYCTGLSQTSEDISNGNSKKLQSPYDLIEVNSTEQGSLENTENYLCTGSIPCDGNELQISTLVNRKKSSENHELNDLSQLFDDREDTDSCGIMSRDHARAATEGTELSSELSADLTECETLKNYNRTSYQDGFEDKPSDLSTVKITTQKSSCNLMFSEKSSEPKDFVLRYEPKNSAGHKKFYSCKDEPDTGIAGTQEENNFRNLAAYPHEDINFEIKLNNLNTETPTHCDASSVESEILNTKITFGDPGQSIEKVQEFSSPGATQDSESQGVLSNYSNLDKNEGSAFSVHLDNIDKEAKLSPDETVINGDNRFSSSNPELGSDKDNRDYWDVENGFLQENSIKTDRNRADEDLNSKLPLHKEDLNSTLNLSKTLINSVSGVVITDNKNENQSNISDDLQGGTSVVCCSEQHFELDSHHKQKQSDVTNLNVGDNNTIALPECDHSSAENANDNKKDINLPDIVENLCIFGAKESRTQSRDSISSPLDETLSDTSEAFTDAEDRVNSPYLDKFNTKSDDSIANGKDSNISCRESTSTESFVDAVESLDDDYLTSVRSFRHSKEFQNEETLSQTSSDSDDSTTSVVGSMEDLSGWEEFSENITDLNDYSGEMEAKRYDVTNNERNTFLNLPDGHTHASVYRTSHDFYDKNYQSPSTSSVSNEIYPSMIKTNSLRYKDNSCDAEQNVIGDSILETGNGGSLKEIYDKGVSAEAGTGSNVKQQDVSNTRQTYQGVTVLHEDNTIQTVTSDTAQNAQKELLENTITKSAVGSKIETAVIKRTQRRRRRQIEQQKGTCFSYSENCTNEESKTISEINESNLHHPENTCDNDSIEKNLSTHSEHFMYSCTVSDNMTFNNEPASGTQVLSEQVNTNLNLNEFNIDLSTNTETPLNYDYEDFVTKEVSMGIDKADTTDCTFVTRKSELILKGGEQQLTEDITCVNEIDNCELLTSGNNDFVKCDDKGKCEIDTCVDISIRSEEKDTTDVENGLQLVIEFQEHVQKTGVDFDDIQFIDADDATNDFVQNENFHSKENCQLKDSETEFKQDKLISPNVSFTFCFEEESTEVSKDLCDEVQYHNSSENATCIKSEIVNERGNSQDLDQLHLKHAVEKEKVEVSVSTTLKESKVNCEINDIDTKYNLSVEDEQNKLYTNEESRKPLSLKDTDTTDILLEKQEVSEESTMHADICEEANISVRHALEIEKQKLGHGSEIRSRKGLFVSKRNERRATIDNCSFQDSNNEVTANESKNDKETSARNSLKKSQSFRFDKKQISPMASFMNPPEITDDNKEPVEHINKKVSDMCKSFMTKTRASVQRTRAQATSKSPAPQRKLMKWVSNQGKWMRIPVNELPDNRSDTNVTQNEHLKSTELDEKSKHITSDTIDNTNTNPRKDTTTENQDNCKQTMSSLEITSEPYVGNLETKTAATINRAVNLCKYPSQDTEPVTGLESPNCHSTDITKAEVQNKTLDSKLLKVSTVNDDKKGLICFQKKSTRNEDAIHISVKSSFETVPDTAETHVEQKMIESPAENENNASRSTETEYLQKESFSSETTTDILDGGENNENKITKDKVDTKPSINVEPLKSETEGDFEMKVIGTTLNDAHCDQEKHLKRQEFLFGLLDSYNRRKPRRFTQHESLRNIQNTGNATENVDKSVINNASITSKEVQENESENPKSIPKIKAVKIQEEVFECKKEYLKDTNISLSSNLDDNSSNVISKTKNERKNSEKIAKQPIRKSKTFSGLGDIEWQKCLMHEYPDVSDETETKVSLDLTDRSGDISGNTRNLGNALSCSHQGVSLASKMVDKRAKAGLKLNLEKAHSGVINTSDRSPNRLDTSKSRGRSQDDKSRGRSQDDKSPNRLCVDQPRMRVRSPEIGQRQIQRSKLLSEIVEVEENKDDISVTCDRRQQQRQYRDRQRQEVQKPVKRSNKRRSLSLPTGTLAFGDARIVYKNGHFTIETMDTSEYESSHPSDYHSSSRHLDSQEDDLWDMPDTNRVKSHSRETTDMHNKPLMRRQNAKTALKSSDSTEDVFYTEAEYAENVSPYRSNLNSGSQVLNMGRTDEGVFNESCSSRASDMSVDSYSSERMDVSTDDSVTDSKKLSSSSLPESKDEEVKIVMQRAKRTSSFRAAQEAGSLRLSGIEEDKIHNSTRARSVSLDESQNTDLNKSPKIQSVQNQHPTFLKKVMAKRKSVNENISGFSKQSESAKDFFTKKMTLKGLFRKNKSDSSVNSPVKTEHPVSPPIATFQDDDIGSVDTPPSSPYRTRDLRRRHTSADILKSYPDSSETDSNCPTPTQERSSVSRHSISTPSTPSHEGNSFMNLSSQSAPPFRDDDEMSITSASSFASSIHSPPFEQPHKPKTPKPVGASPRRNPSVGSHLSRSGSQSSQRNVLNSVNSVTSLESDQFESLHDDVLRDSKCECNCETRYRKQKSSNRNVKGSADSLAMCQFCKQREFYKSDSAFSSSSFHKQQLSSKEKLSEDSVKLRRDSSGRSNYDRLGIISQTDVASSNSNDSGIQRDASLHSSNESIKGTPDSRVRLRRNKSLSPHPDRPKSEISVKWADGDSGDYDITETPIKLRHKNLRDRPRPKSDLDGSSFLSGRLKAFGSEVNLQPYCSLRSLYEMRRHDHDRQKNRRMSTPHPIKSRLQRAPHKLQKQPPLVRSSSMPESLEKIHKRRKMHHLLDFHLDSLSRHMDIDDLSDASDLSFDQASLQERSVSVQSSTSQLTAMDEDEDNLTYAEALWDHITMDPEELAFRAQDVIEVLDMADKDWWFGVIEDREGWFPATFVRIRVNQDQLDDDLDLDTTIQDNLTTSPKLRRISMFNKNQARSNVVNEIINAEREYVKHLKDVVEGYIQHARKRIEMFPEERISLIFGNIETIYSFAKKFLAQLEMCIDVCPHLSEIGQCFLDNERGFEIYSDYCNNHPSACEELDELCKDSKYKHFFEACRLLQELVEIPLEGFLLTPVQKICKYPLQLAELLKYTPPDHPDYVMVKDALAAMRKIATLINERKRKMESIEKIAVWQHSVVDWEGPDLLERSSELIFSGELNKINTAGWSQERFFFLFDHQLVYCKKELLKRHVFSYKGRIDLDHCDIVDVPDGKESQYNVTVKHAWKFHETHKDKWYLVYAKSEAVKQHWLKAIKTERQRVLEDQENDFCVPDHWKQTVLNKVRSQSHIKDKHWGRSSHGQLMSQKDLKDFTYATLPRHGRISQKHDKKKGWFKFGGGKKSKR